MDPFLCITIDIGFSSDLLSVSDVCVSSLPCPTPCFLFVDSSSNDVSLEIRLWKYSNRLVLLYCDLSPSLSWESSIVPPVKETSLDLHN